MFGLRLFRRTLSSITGENLPFLESVTLQGTLWASERGLNRRDLEAATELRGKNITVFNEASDSMKCRTSLESKRNRVFCVSPTPEPGSLLLLPQLYRHSKVGVVDEGR